MLLLPVCCHVFDQLCSDIVYKTLFAGIFNQCNKTILNLVEPHSLY